MMGVGGGYRSGPGRVAKLSLRLFLGTQKNWGEGSYVENRI